MLKLLLQKFFKRTVKKMPTPNWAVRVDKWIQEDFERHS